MNLQLMAKFALLTALPMLVGAAAVASPVDYVNTLGGTDSRYDLSHGNVLPLVSLPWSFDTWAPQTDNDASYASWWFHPTDRRFFGIRCTHQPSPWISDYGAFRISASITDPGHSDPWQYSGYDPDASTWKPYYFNASLIAYGTQAGFTTVEFTGTNHGGMMRVTFPPYVSGPTATGFNQTRRILLALNTVFSDSATVSYVNGSTVFAGHTNQNSGGVTPNFAHYIYMTISSGVAGSPALQPMSTQFTSNSGTPYAFADYDATNQAADVIIVRVATSLISADQAYENYLQEVQGQDFDTLVNTSKAAWNNILGRINIIDVGSAYTPAQQSDMLTTFYSALYRATQFPRMLHERAANGSTIHYSPYDGVGNIYEGVLTSDSGFWDAYRTVYPFLSLAYPDVLGQLMQGWVNAYKEGGWLPKWASPGYRGSMVGTLGDVSLADAIIKRIPGFDVQTAYQAIRKDAFQVPGPADPAGRDCLSSYLQLGYIPQDSHCYEVVSRSQNYYLSDFAISQAAAFLGYTSDARALALRSMNYTLLFDKSTGFFRSRDDSGQFTQPFDEFAWGGDYTEAGPWQYRAYVPHDPNGLASLYAGAGLDLCDTLQEAQTMPSVFHIGNYGTEIHEMTEMALLCWGQYEHDNQPVHYMLPMMVALSSSVTGKCAARGQYWLRKAVTTLYKPTADMFCGDEDNGEMSAWYLLNALGLYALAPGTSNYVVGSPLFAHAQIALLNGQTLDIVTYNNSATNVYVTAANWNNKAVQGVTVDYFDLMAGGTLTFNMTSTPVTRSSSRTKHLRHG